MTYSHEIVERIKEKHALKGEPSLMAFTGMVNEAWAIGVEYVLRINTRPDCDDEAAREALVVPVVRAAGIRTPELIAFDDSRDIVPRPYTVYRRAPGVLLGNLEIDPARLMDLYQEIGRELAALHSVVPPKGIRPPEAIWQAWDTRKQIARARDAECLSAEEAKEMEVWLDFIEPLLGKEQPDSLIHKDIHPWNLMVDPTTFELTAVLDWGDASLGDASAEFASMPLVAVVPMFSGYSSAGEQVDEFLIARSLRAGLGLATWEIREGDMKNYKRSWWRMPTDGWTGYKTFLMENYPSLALPFA